MPKNILVVDDQPSLRQMLRFALTSQGYTVTEAEDGVEALKKIAKTDIDMLIVDWQMPLMNGLELVRRLRDDSAYADLPIVVVSCWDDLAARKEAYSMGVMTWLKKPFRMAEVHRVVESGLGLAATPPTTPVQSSAARLA